MNAAKARSSEATTMMVRNLPPALKQQEFVRELDDSGFEGDYDICYLPRDFSSKQCKGYAFLNFRSSADASRFRSAWHGASRFGCQDALLNVSPARIQGYEANAAQAASAHVSKT